MRLIDADALYAALMEESTVIARGTGRNCLALACKSVAAMVQDAPTIDAVPVVRCGDCKHFLPDRNGDNWGMCTYIGQDPIARNDFGCLGGERKENDETD